MSYRLLELSRMELREAARWYEAKRDGLGHEFLDEVRDALQRMIEMPDAWPRLSARTRRIRLRRFPYGLVYQRRSDVFLILAVMHLSRRPGYWRDR